MTRPIALLPALAAAVAGFAGSAAAQGFLAHYSASWAGLPAGEVSLETAGSAGSYADRIRVTSRGLSWLFTHFRGRAEAEGRLAGGGPQPSRYEAVYDLHRRRDSRISMRFVARDGAVVAERGAGDTSRKPPLAGKFRRDVVDPLSALEGIRDAVRHARGAPGGAFAVRVYDGARRFDVLGRIVAKDARNRLLRLKLSLRPIAGFKGETSEDADPDDAPRPVQLALTDDARLVPVSMTVPIWFLPLVVRLDYACDADGAALPATTSDAGNGRRDCRR